MSTAPARTPFMEELKRLTRGLSYQSESDYPVEAVLWEGRGGEPLTVPDLLKLTKHRPGTSVKTTTLERFFGPAVEQQDWYGAEERRDAERFGELLKTLKERLKGVKVYKVGEVEVDVYVVGRTESGDLAGVSTKVIET